MIDRRTRARYRPAKRRRRPFELLAFLALFATAAVAQPTTRDSHPETPAPLREVRPLVFGASLFPSLTLDAASFPVAAAGGDCGTYGSSTRFTTSIDAFALWQTPWHDRLWLTLRAGYRDLDARLVGSESARPFRNGFENRIDTALMVTRYDVRRNGVEIALGGAFAPAPWLLLGAAPTLAISSTATATHTDSIVLPREARFENGSWTRPFGRGTDVEFTRVVIGLELGAQARVPIGERWALWPGIRGSMTLTPVAANVTWRSWSLGAGIGIGFDAAPRPRPDTVPVVAAQMPPRRRPFLKATITAVGIDEEGREYPDPIIEIEETPWLEIVPLLPYVFFDSGSASLASRYHRLAGREQSSRFSVDSLLDVGPIDIHWHVLNVIGGRLRRNPAVRGTIIGTGSGDEPAGTAPSVRALRAQAVRRYLATVWGIDSSRLTIATSPSPAIPSAEETSEGRAENRRVEFSFSDPSVLEPVTIRRTASIASPPAVRFSHRIFADTLVAEWRISVVQGEKELLRFIGTSDEESLKQDKLWSLADLRINRDLSEIRYRLDVRDVTGQTTAADGRFRVVERVRRNPEDTLGSAPRIVEHFLVGFNYNSSELLPAHRRRLDEIAETITPDDELLLVGYTDRVGSQERNRQLSLERADVVHAALLEKHRSRLPEASAITVRGYGPQEELFDNGLPEGRMFSRMVRAIVTSYRDE